MPKSSYPNKIDSSVELPIVRNNVTEINAEFINSLRDAIIQIEKTLGINPQGNSTVSERISSVIDQSGEIRKEAFDKAGVIYGPITNDVISKVAAIEESKLRLDFPTRLIQSEVTLLKTELENFINIIEEISAKLSSHINTLSESRHNTNNISVSTLSNTASDTSTSGFAGGSLTEALEDIYNKHILFSGSATQASNSHNASQVYFNNSSVSDLIQTTDVQTAIETLADQKTNSLKTNVFHTNANGIIRKAKYFDLINNVDGKLKLDFTSVSYSATTSQRQVITLITPTATLYEIEKFDILEISSGVSEEDDKQYLIVDFEVTTELLSVTILGGTKNDSGVNSQIRILKNPYEYSNENAYNTVVRPRYNRTNTPDIIVAHPNSATIITQNIAVEKISTTKANIGLEIDGTSYDIPIYNPARGTTNTLDEIIFNFNEYCSDNKIPVFAYKYRDISCNEIAISHIIPTWLDSSVNRYIKATLASSNDASSEFGISNLIDVEIYGNYGNAVLINGNIISDNNSFITYSDSDLSLVIGGNTILFSVLNPIAEGIKIGNLCYVEGNGLYRVSLVLEDRIILDDQGDTFSSALSENDRVFIYKGTVSLEELEFSEIVGPDGSLILDIFMTENLEYGYNIRATIESSLINSSFYGIIKDISKNYLTSGTDIISISSSGLVTVNDGVSTSSGDQIYSSGEYIIRTPSGSSFYKLEALNGPLLTTSLSVNINGFDELPENLIHLSRCVYSTSFGFIIGDSSFGIPTLTDKRPSGTLNEVNVSSSLIEKYITGPRSELRDDGTLSGLDFYITGNTTTNCLLSINPGFYYNSGIRYKFDGIENLPVVHDGTSFYVAFDKNGCLKVGNEISDPIGSGMISPFYGDKVTYLAYMIVRTGGSIVEVDLRKNISFIDKKIDQIIVAKESGAGHFTDVKDAVNYARYYKMFNKSDYIPSILIKNGTYEINERIILDFDVEISGSGPSTVLVQGNDIVSSSFTEEMLSLNYLSAMFLIGSDNDALANQSLNINNGIRITNMKLKTSNDYDSATNSNFNFFILITQGIIDNEETKIFKFDNIVFEGSSSMLETDDNTSGLLNGVRQIIPIGFGLASDSPGISPTIYGNLMVESCIFRYVGSGWTTIGGIISKAGSYTIKDISIFGNIIKNASPANSRVSTGEYNIFDSSVNYSMSGFTYPTLSSVTLTMENISVAGNALAD